MRCSRSRSGDNRIDVSRNLEDVFWSKAGRRMDTEYSQRVRSSNSSSTHSCVNSGSIHTPVPQRTGVRKNRKRGNSILAKLAPISAIATLPFFPITTHAMIPVQKGIGTVIIEKGVEQVNEAIKEEVKQQASEFSISQFLGIDKKIQELADNLHQQALLTPDPKDDTIDFVKYLYDVADQAILTRYMPTWLKDIVICTMASIGEMCHSVSTWMYHSLYKFVSTVVLYTPTWIFEDSWFPKTIAQFSGLSVAVVSVFSMFEGIKRICRLNYTPLGFTLKRLPLALFISAATPFLFVHGVRLLNLLTNAILRLGNDVIDTNKPVSISQLSLLFEPLNLASMFFFIFLFGVMCIPLVWNHGKRWFDIMAMGVLTPFAMSAYLFRSTEHYFYSWLDTIKRLGMTQLAYAIFITLMGVLMFGTPTPTTVAGGFTKMLITFGAFHRIVFPPQFVTNLGRDKTLIDMFVDMKGKFDKFKTTTSKTLEKTDDVAIKSASIAGKVWRFFTKK